MKYKNSSDKSIALSLIGFAFFSCTTISTPKTSAICFKTAESLAPDSTKEYVLKTLGKPGFIPDPKILDMSAIPANEELWYYLDPVHHSDRLSVVFDRRTDKVISVGWSIKENEPESDLAYLQKKYPTAHFRVPSPDSNQHFIPDERYYIDDDLGLQFTYRIGRGKVDSITWWAPEDRSLAEEKRK